MKVIITKSQYQKVIFNLLDMLYGPEISFTQDDDSDQIEILSDDDTEIFRVYTKEGRSKGCKRDLLVLINTIREIQSYVPPAVLRKKLFSKTIVSYVNKKTNLKIDCIDFGYGQSGRYTFNVKKNKRPK
jgi:hypothetical protein